ncbi:MAG TPA: nickel pincer cofactor biosynthesis protein LarC [Deltaproteobacteria bacterium]|nr:nickel pincer cofactor biosynthesis protein LarC [Deltaproteobacteria bacterium]HOM28114.1 nickel pincer cofactor biosynthesis protein LarC [Deltaproteobacteria bacterium]
MKVLVVDPAGGVAGDMILAGLIHLGCPPGLVEESLDALGLGRCGLKVTRREEGGVGCLHVEFEANRDDEQRPYRRIRDVILPRLEPGPRDLAARIFEVLARAEAAVHGVEPEDVHFHELGALDSIFDIVGIAVALDRLGVSRLYTRPVPLGSGWVDSSHGRLPVPAPATMRLLEGFPVRFEGPPSEIATPTGAAVIAALASPLRRPPVLRVSGTGYGCGSKRFENWPNVCRLVLCEDEGSCGCERVFVVEADIDDMTPEDASSALARIMEAGALDAGFTHRTMKRSRPGYTIQAICPEGVLARVVESFVKHTSTLGVRYHAVERLALPRRVYGVDTPFGEISVKEAVLPDGTVRVKPEHRDLERISSRTGKSVLELRAEVELAIAGRKGDEPT